MSQIRIRQVDIADKHIQELIYALHHDVFAAEEWVGNTIPRFNRGWWWIAYHGSEGVGFGGMVDTPPGTWHAEWVGSCYLCSAGVVPSFRGYGLQRRLIAKRLEHARRLGKHTAYTDTLFENHRSMNNLIECGFRPFMPMNKWGTVGEAVYWRRVL